MTRAVKRQVAFVMAMVMVLTMAMGSTSFAAYTEYPSIEYANEFADEVTVDEAYEIDEGYASGDYDFEYPVTGEYEYGQEEDRDQKVTYPKADEDEDYEEDQDEDYGYDVDCDDLEDVLPLYIMPMTAFEIIMLTDADMTGGEIEVNDEIIVTVRWRSVPAPAGSPFTITATNGAEILIHDQSDIAFYAAGSPGTINNLVAEGNVVTFRTSTPAVTPLENEIRFTIQSPSASGEFSLSVKIGLPGSEPISGRNFIERSFEASAGFFVDTSYDLIIGDMPFDIFGEIGRTNISGTVYMVIINVIHTDYGNMEIERVGFANPDGSFMKEGVTFPSNAPEGIYVVLAMLLDSGGNIIDTAEREIEYARPLPTITINSTHDTVYVGEEFVVYGEVSFDGLDMIMLLINDTNGEPVNNPEFNFDVPDSGEFAFDSWSFSDSHLPGVYTIAVYAIAGIDMIYAYIEIELIEYQEAPIEVNPTNPRDGSNIAYQRTGAVMGASSSLNLQRLPSWANNGISAPPLANQSWQAAEPANAPQYLYVDFGEVREFNRVVIFQNGFRILGYRLSYSVDGITWNTFLDGDHLRLTTEAGVPFEHLHYERLAGRFVRLDIDLSINVTPVSIFEFEVYNMPEIANVTIRAINYLTGEDLIEPIIQQLPHGRPIFHAPDVPGYLAVDIMANGRRSHMFGFGRYPATVDEDTEIVFLYGPRRTVTIQSRRAGQTVHPTYTEYHAEGFSAWFNAIPSLGNLASARVNGLPQAVRMSPSWIQYIEFTITGDTTIIFEYGPASGNPSFSSPDAVSGVVLSGSATWAGNPNAIARNSNRSLTIRGQVMSGNRPVANTEIIAGAFNPSGGIGVSRIESGPVRTDNNGNFSITFTPNVTSVSQVGDWGSIYIRPSSSAGWIWSRAVQFQFFV